MPRVSPEQIRTARAKRPRLYARDFAEDLGITEADLCAAFVGIAATRISARPDDIFPHLPKLGQVMALTRNDSCVIEKVGTYDHYRAGPEGASISNPPIELRLFPAHFVHGFALDESGPNGPKRSIQIFDAAGEAVHKIHLRPETRHEQWAGIIEQLRIDDQTQTLDLIAPSPGTNAPAPRLAEARRLAKGAVERLLYRAAETGTPTMVTVGNHGCIEIHAGPIVRVLESGPWINVLDPGLELHLRMDHIAGVWVDGAGHVEAVDGAGRLIARLSGEAGTAADWAALVAELADFKAE